MGEIYNESSWVDLDDFTINGATAVVNAGKIDFSAGVTTSVQSLDLNRYTCLEKWSLKGVFKVGEKSASSNGFGLGIRSYNTFAVRNNFGRFVMNSNPASGKLFQHAGDNGTYSGSFINNNEDVISFSVNDEIELTVSMDRWTMTTRARNLTTGSGFTEISYTFLTPTGSPPLHNVGRFAIFNAGGAYTLQSLEITSSDIQNPKYLFVGDSKTRGFRATTGATTRFASKFLDANHPSTVVNGGPSDRIAHVALRVTDEIISLNPQNVILQIGSNDKRAGTAEATILSDYDALVTSLANAGIRVVHIGPLYETAADQSFLYTHLASTYNSADVIDPGVLTLDADGIHPNQTGHDEIYNAIINSGKL